MTRNRFLAVASALGAVAGILNLTSGALFLADQVSMNYLTALNVAEGLYVLSAMFTIGGFAAALGGFLAASPSSRRRLLGLAGGSFAASGAAGVAVNAIRAVEYGTHDVPATFTASAAVEAASSLAFLAAGALVAVAFLTSSSGRRTDTALAWAGIGLALFFCFFSASAFLALVGYSDFHSAGGITGGVGVEAAGALVGAAGAVIAGIAFLSSEGGRAGLLAAAAVALGVGLMVVAVGDMVYAGSYAVFQDGKSIAADWLEAVSWLGLTFAAWCAAVGFRAGTARQS